MNNCFHSHLASLTVKVLPALRFFVKNVQKCLHSNDFHRKIGRRDADKYEFLDWLDEKIVLVEACQSESDDD